MNLPQRRKARPVRMDEDYGDGHKIFVQSMMSRGVMNAAEVREIVSECGVDPKDKEKLAAFLRLINTKIAPIHLEIRKGVEEEDGTICYVLANTVETPISRLSSTYSSLELELFKKLVESIVESAEGKIGSLAAMNLTDKLERRMGKEEAQNFFNRLEEDKWIRKNADGKILLSVRSLVELDQYVLDVYADYVKRCNICNKVCLLGEECANCGIKLHFRCSSVVFSKQGPEKKCPDCRAPWGQVVIR